MKKSALLIAFFVLASCSDNPNNTTQTSQVNAVQEKSITENNNLNLKPLASPCQLSGDSITEILKWTRGSEGNLNAINSDTRKGCNYGSQNGQLEVAFERLKQRYIDQKYLEKSFITILESKNSKMTTQQVNENIGDQAIFSTGKNGPNYTYELKWRLGNHTQKSVAFKSSTAQDENQKLQQLIKIANSISP